MSIKRSSAGRQGGRGFGDPGRSSTKIDRQELYDELRRLAETDDPFAPADLAASLGITETVAKKYLLLLSTDGFLESVEGGLYRAGPMNDVTLAQLQKEIQAAAKSPQREKDLQDIARLKGNNDIMRKRLLEAVAERDLMRAERDHYLALLKEHGIDPGPPQAPAAAAATPSATDDAPASDAADDGAEPAAAAATAETADPPADPPAADPPADPPRPPEGESP